MHYGRSGIHIGQQGGGEETLFRIHLAAVVNRAVLQVAAQPSKCPVAHDAHEMLLLLRILAQQVVKFFRQQTKEFLFHFLLHQQIIRRNTCLSRVEQLTPRYALGGYLQVRRTVDDARALAA